MPAIQPDEKYATWAAFIDEVVIESGCVMGTGRANLKEFHDRYSPFAVNVGLRLSYGSFKSYALNQKPSPRIDSQEALAVMLSAAKGVRITPEKMATLINRKALDELATQIKDGDLPGHEMGDGVVAAGLLRKFRNLPIEARRSIAPALLKQLAADWEYLDSDGNAHVAILLRREIDLRGMGLPTYAKKVLGDKIPMPILESIINGNPDPNTIKPDHVLALSEHMRSVDGGKIDIADLQCLNPKLKLPKISGGGAQVAH